MIPFLYSFFGYYWKSGLYQEVKRNRELCEQRKCQAEKCQAGMSGCQAGMSGWNKIISYASIEIYF